MEFVQLPPSVNDERAEKWRNIVKELRDHRMEWGFVGNYSPGVPAQIRAGAYPAFIDRTDSRPAHVQMSDEWEVVSRSSDSEHKRCDVYIRYIGG